MANPMVLDTARPTPSRLVRTTIFALLVAVLAGAAIVLQIHGWSAILTETGGACGGRNGPCPQGTFPVTGLSLLVGIFTVPLVLRRLFRRPRFIAVLTAIGMVAGGFLGNAGFDYFHGATLSIAWSAPYDASNTLVTEGVWSNGDALVRVRADELVSYAAATGASNWTLPIPGQNVVCALSYGTAGSVGILGYADNGQPCDHLAAIDLATGKQLWSTRIDATDQTSGPALDVLAATGNLVVAAENGGATGYDARTGATRWTQPPAGGCVDEFVGADAGSVVTVSTCDQDYIVSQLDPATGKPRWQHTVPEPATDYQLSLVSVAPVVVNDSLPGARGTDDLRVFDSRGDLTHSIPVNDIPTSDGPTALDTTVQGDDTGFGPQPILWTHVSGQVVAGVTNTVDDHRDLVGFSLATGRQLWLTPLPDDIDALGVQGGRLIVIDDAVPSLDVYSVDAATGARSQLGVLDGSDFGQYTAAIVPVGGQDIVINGQGTSPTPPLFAFHG